MRVRCLACACAYETDDGPRPDTLCPRRYLSPHTEEHMQKVVSQLVAHGVDVRAPISPGDHQRAIRALETETDCD